MCFINLVVPDSDKEGVKLLAGEAKLKTSKELTEYYITDDPESPTLIAEAGGVSMKIVFKRRLTKEAVMTWLPSLLLIIISYATSFFRLPNFFNTAITVNLTVMLTTTTLLISVVKKLAPTSYIKWIEAWLIFAQLIPFTQVILITLIELFRKSDPTTDQTRVRTAEDEVVKRSKQHCWLDVNYKLVKVTLSSVSKECPVEGLVETKFPLLSMETLFLKVLI